MISNSKLPIAIPGKIICVGLNYKDHAAEAKIATPKQPLIFAKWQNSLIGDGESIVLPAASEFVDYEAELGIVIGCEAKNLLPEQAMDAIKGYVCLNDITARDLQFSDGQWTRSKSFDTFCPVGPALVPTAKIKDPQNLGIVLKLNGRVMQDSTTRNMIFGVADLVTFVSNCVSLQSGDLIATGTPAGVGYFKQPQVSLRSGDIVSVEIEGIGVLSNPVK